MKENDILAKEHFDFGIHLVSAGDLEHGILAFCKAIELKPEYSQAYNNLGLVFLQKNQLPEAEAFFQRALQLAPEDFHIYHNIGLLLLEKKHYIEAKYYFEQSIQLCPGLAEGYNHLGIAHEELNEDDEAEAAYRKALTLNALYAEAYYNLGNLLKTDKRLAEAEALYKKALTVKSNFQQAQFALSSLYLLQGRFDEGWAKYDEFRIQSFSKKPDSIPCWQGEDLSGQSILLFYEQGFGDTIQFVRYVREVAEQAAKTTVWLQQPLASLFGYVFPQVKIYCNSKAPTDQYDVACAIPSLPRLLKATEENLSGEPYIKPLPQVVKHWQKKLQVKVSSQNQRIGLVWSGNPAHHNDHNRSIPLNLFQELFALPHIAWISLQVGDRAQEAQEFSSNLLDFSAELTDFAQTSGLIHHLDLVISVDSAVAHLAGAMGKRTWLLLPFDPDWRWQQERCDSPWYDSIRLFRQKSKGNWQDVIQKVKNELTI